MWAPNYKDYNVLGCFNESDCGHLFEFADNTRFITHKGMDFPHIIFVGPCTDVQTRFALVKKTVAYVIVDEDADGFVVEKWDIKKTRFYKK